MAFSFLTQKIAIDLGTANTIIIHNDKIVVDEPSIVAIDQNTGKLLAIGKTARLMQGKTHDFRQMHEQVVMPDMTCSRKWHWLS